ncbi:MAG: GNAT family N-acetyltransferase [Candidatus Nealsonbacteria bacterium]|nr:GNAT family N-acetyltransferase [Candidatus Nealsonbacteria bacterium]
MKVIPCRTPRALLERIGPRLAENEVENNLVLGVLADIQADPDQFAGEACLLLVEAEGDPIGAALMTPPRELILTRLPTAAMPALVEHLRKVGKPPPGVVGPSPETRSFAQCWAVRTGMTARLGMQQTIYECARVSALDHSPGVLRAATAADVDPLAEWRRQYRREVGLADEDESHRAAIARRIARGQLHVWEDGQAVSMACFGGETDRGVRLFLVYTPPQFRARGYATACVGSLTGRLLDSGKTYCCLYADQGNSASNGVYRKVGYRPIGDAEIWQFK